MASDKNKKLEKILDQLAAQQRAITECRDYYQQIEKELEQAKEHIANPEDLIAINRDIATLNREYEEKGDLLYEELNQRLIDGHLLAKEIGHEAAHDFKQLWDYMTDSVHREVELKRVILEIEQIKKAL